MLRLWLPGARRAGGLPGTRKSRGGGAAEGSADHRPARRGGGADQPRRLARPGGGARGGAGHRAVCRSAAETGELVPLIADTAEAGSQTAATAASSGVTGPCPCRSSDRPRHGRRLLFLAFSKKASQLLASVGQGTGHDHSTYRVMTVSTDEGSAQAEREEELLRLSHTRPLNRERDSESSGPDSRPHSLKGPGEASAIATATSSAASLCSSHSRRQTADVFHARVTETASSAGCERELQPAALAPRAWPMRKSLHITTLRSSRE